MLGQQPRKVEATEKEGRKCPCVVTGCVPIVLWCRLGFVAAGDVFVRAAELGAEFLSVVSLFLLCLVTVLIVFLIKTVFWLMPFSVVRPP